MSHHSKTLRSAVKQVIFGSTQLVLPLRVLKNPLHLSFCPSLLVNVTNDGTVLFFQHYTIPHVRENPSITWYLVPTFAFHFFSGIVYLKEKMGTNQRAPINLVKTYFYFDLSPWLFKGSCRMQWFSFLCHWQTDTLHDSDNCFYVGKNPLIKGMKNVLMFIDTKDLILANQVFFLCSVR